ncbi:C40 family peptidase [Paenibacillus cremeus]|nr:C40 family peptidase [Paenibacillus cremeus]
MMKKMMVTFAVCATLLAPAASLFPTKASAAATSYPDEGRDIAYTAGTYSGKVKYSFGTNNPSNLVLDCSAFTKYIYGLYGIDLPWGSKAQANMGQRIYKESDLQPGDLVFFSVGTPGQINHAGIYAGNGQFIGNSPSVGVSTFSMTTGYWADRFISGVRML